MQGKATRGRSAQGRARSRVNAGGRNAAPRLFGGWQLRKEALKAGERDRLSHAGNGHMRQVQEKGNVKQQIKEIPPFSFDESSDLPMWVQLRNRMAYLITSGFYKPGEKLPTVRKYAAELRIAYNTVSKAYMGLERDGYVTTVRGSGVFVNDPDAILKPAPEVDALVEEFVKGCLENGMAYDDIPKMVSSCVRRMKKDYEKAQG